MTQSYTETVIRKRERERVLDKFLKDMRAEMTSPFEYLDWDSIEAVYIRLREGKDGEQE
jgi:hypothetical protein